MTLAIAAAVLCAAVGIIFAIRLVRYRRGERERLDEALGGQAAALAEAQLRSLREFQKRLLPPADVDAVGCHVSGRSVPAGSFGSDFYQFIALGKDRLVIAVGDINVQGLPACLILATLKGMLPLIGADPAYAAALLGRLNEQMSAQLGDREFVAMALALYVAGEQTLSIANAGLPDPLLVGHDGVARPIDVAGPRYPVGIRRNMSYESVTLKLTPGDRVFFYTDGLADPRLVDEVGRAHGDIESVFSAIGAPRSDDRTAVVLERTA